MSLTNSNDIYDEKYLVCCGYHVRHFATFLAAITILLYIASSFIDGLSSVICMAMVESLIIFADKKERPWAYIPFLIIMATGIIAAPILLIIVIAKGGANFLEISTTSFILLVVFTVIGVGISIYRWYIVYRARQYMIDEVISGNTQRQCQNQCETV